MGFLCALNVRLRYPIYVWSYCLFSKDLCYNQYTSVQILIDKFMKNTYKINGNTAIIYGEKRNGSKFEFIIDAEDLKKISPHSWSLVGGVGRQYPRAMIESEPVYLHHFLIGKPGKGEETDHFDRDRMNNTRANLSHVKLSQNRTNRKITNKHGFPGLYFIPERNKSYSGGVDSVARPWQVRMRIKNSKGKGKNTKGVPTSLLHLGVFATKEEAIAARREAEKKYFGVVLH